MKTTKQTLENEQEVLTNQFENLHSQLLEKKEFLLAKTLSELYYKTRANQYIQGIQFMRDLYKL